MFLKQFFLNLTTKLSNRSLVLLLELSLLLHTPVIIWLKLGQIFLRRSFNHLYDWDILTASFLFGRTEKQNLKSLWKDLIIFCRTNLYTSHQKKKKKKKIAFLDLNFSLENGSVTIDLHTKSTDCHQHFHYSSSHADHIKKFHHL